MPTHSFHTRGSVSLETNGAYVGVFLTLQAAGGIGLFALVCTALFSKTVYRSPTWTNVCVCWVMSCISYLVLLLGGQIGRTDPNHALCLIQAILTYSTPPLIASATLALTIELWYSLRTNTAVLRLQKGITLRTLCLVQGPYCLFLIISIEALVVGLKNPDKVGLAHSGMYCAINSTIPVAVSTILVSVLVIVVLVMEAIIGRSAYTNWKALRHFGEDQTNHLSFYLFVRVAVFSGFSVASIFLSISRFFSSAQYSPHANVFLSSLPFTLFLLFGSQMDIIQCWMFWRKPVIAAYPTVTYPALDLEKELEV